MVGFIGDLSGWQIFKTRAPDELTDHNKQATYRYQTLDENHLHQGFQFILSGILSVYYDQTRHRVKRPGYTAFPQRPARELGKISFDTLR